MEILVIVLVVFFLFGGGGYYGYRRWVKRRSRFRTTFPARFASSGL